MKKLWLLLLSFIFLGIGDDTASGGGADAGGDAGGGDDGLGDDSGSSGDDGGGEGDDSGDGDDGGGGEQQQARSRAPDHTAEARQAREEAARARAEIEELRRRLPQPSSDEQRIQEEEERKLRDPKTPEIEKWTIQSNRTLRDTDKRARNAEFRALDLNDKTDFNLKCAENKRLSAVKADVEAELTRMRSRGQNAPREAVAYYILGQKVANAKTPAPKPNQNQQQGRDRGAPVRSDLRGRGAPTSEREKRIRRLENVQI